MNFWTTIYILFILISSMCLHPITDLWFAGKRAKCDSPNTISEVNPTELFKHGTSEAIHGGISKKSVKFPQQKLGRFLKE